MHFFVFFAPVGLSVFELSAVIPFVAFIFQLFSTGFKQRFSAATQKTACAKAEKKKGWEWLSSQPFGFNLN